MRWEKIRHNFFLAHFDHARSNQAEKRGGEFEKLQLVQNFDQAAEKRAELIRLDDALREHAKIDPDTVR